MLPPCLELPSKACRQNKSTSLAVRPINRVSNSRKCFYAGPVSSTIAIYLVGYNNHWCSLALQLDDDRFQPEDS
jgi:hypothetical protein